MSSFGGYTCSVCGTRVNAGAYHSCGGSPVYSVSQTATDATIAMGLGRIEALLEQILARLARLEERAP